MEILIETSSVRAKASELEKLIKEVVDKRNTLETIQRRLDNEIKYKSNIGNSINSVKLRMSIVESRMRKINSLLLLAANSYESTEKKVVSASSKLVDKLKGLNVGAVTVSEAKSEKKWYQSNWFKLAVGAVVIGVAVGAVILTGGVALAVGAAVGAVVGAGIGGVIGGVSSSMSGGKFIDGFSDGFMWGSISGAASGVVAQTGIGLMGAALADGAIDSAVYVGQTVQNDGNVTLAGVGISFATGTAFSAIGSTITNKFTKPSTNANINTGIKETVSSGNKYKSFANANDANAWASNGYAGWLKNLTSEQKEAIKAYTGPSCYENMNAVLRGIEKNYNGNNAEYVRILSEALDNASIPENVTLYRGTNQKMLGDLIHLDPADLVGKNIQDNAFMSASLISDVADGAFKGDLKLIIDAPAGTKGGYVASLSPYQEVELLLNKGQEMIIKEVVNSDPSNLILRVEIIN